MKKNRKDESWRERYIRLLTIPLEGKDELSEEDKVDLEAVDDLITAGFFNGKIHRSHDGDLFGSLNGPTLEGRIFAEEQQQILDQRSLWGRIKNGAGVSIGWIAGVISSLLVYYITKSG